MFIFLLICLTIAALLAIAWFYSRGVIVLVASVLWAIFPFYNFWILTNCSGDCNIRIDLLLVGPILLIVSVLALVSVVRRAWRKRKVSRASND